MKLMQEFKINYNYEVHFTKKLFHPKNSLLKQVLGEGSSVMVFIDSGFVDKNPSILNEISQWFLDNLDITLLGAIEVVRGGEFIKNDFGYINVLSQKMLQAKVCRHSYILAIGGGAVLDTIGFVSSIFHRGIRHIRIPTTTLSQADSGVGVKNGINFAGIKNLLGNFAPPYAVINDFLYLESLPYRDALAGLAEAFKVAIIKNAKFYQMLKKSVSDIEEMHLDVVEKIVYNCAKIHHHHITSCTDAFERTNARPLDFGHWVAHRLESMSNSELRHGEAVAIGLVFDSYCAVDLGILSKEIADDIYQTLKKSGFTLYHQLLSSKEKNGTLKIVAGLEEFREHLGGELTLIMPIEIGKTTAIHQLPKETIIKVVKNLKEKFQD